MAKLWERPWTPDEMKGSAANWNLAGDAGLLKYLQQFSQGLIGRIHTTNSAMDDMFRKLNNVSTEINNVNNTFLSLANTQFVENRVYEDEEKDSPTANKEQLPQPKSKEATEAEMIQRVKMSLEIGFAVMDTKFNAIEVSGSDSEDEESPSSVIRTVLEPKNPYLHWPLPYLIGSAEFMADDSVGLITNNEDVMTPPLTTHSSTSDLNEDLVEKSRDSVVKQASDWLSETEDMDMFGRDSSPEELDFVAPSSQQAKSAVSFAEELSSKLGGVASTGTDTRSADLWGEPEKASSTSNDGITSTKNALPTSVPSLFGPSNDLFHDDDDAHDIFTIQDKKKPQVSALFDESTSTSHQKERGTPQQKVEPTFLEPKRAINRARNASTPNVGDEVCFASPADISNIETSSKLFDDDDEDGDDLFTVSSLKPKQDVAQDQSKNVSNDISVLSAESPSIPIENILNLPVVGSFSSGLFSFSDVSNIPVEPQNLSANFNKRSAEASGANQVSQGWLDKNTSNSNSLFDEDGVNDSLFHSSHRAAADEPSSVNKRRLSLFENDIKVPVDALLETEGIMSEKSLFDDEELFSQSSHEPNFDIFGSSEGKMRSDDLFSFQPSSIGASDIFHKGSDETDDIFSASKSGSAFNEDVEDLFSSSSSQKSQSSEPKMNLPANLNKQNTDLFSVPQISSSLKTEVKDLFSSFPSQKILTIESKKNLPANLSKQTADIFLDDDDADVDLFGLKANALGNDGTISLFHGAPLEANEEEPNIQSGHISGDQRTFLEPLPGNREKPYLKPIDNDKEKQLEMFKEPLPALQKVESYEPTTSVVTEMETTTEAKPWGKEKVIGKIKTPVGFVVDPLALLPGSKPPPREKLTANDQVSGSGLRSDSQAIKISVDSTSKEKGPSDATPSSSSFDDSKAAPTLHSAVKERAKIQVKRRPQSRRARHEAIRSSALLEDGDFVSKPPIEEPTFFVKDKSPEKTNVDTTQKSTRSETTSSRATILSDTLTKGVRTAQDIASPSTDEEDLFGVPQIIYKDKGEIEDSLFGSATVLSPYDEKDLGILSEAESSSSSKFPSQPDIVKSKLDHNRKTRPNVNILPSDPFSSDEILFSSSTSDLKDSLFMGTGSSKIVPKKTTGPKKTTKSLFDDEDDDDIFSKPSKTPMQAATKSAQAPQTRTNPPVVKSSLRKTEDPFSDPLTSLPQL